MTKIKSFPTNPLVDQAIEDIKQFWKNGNMSINTSIAIRTAIIAYADMLKQETERKESDQS